MHAMQDGHDIQVTGLTVAQLLSLGCQLRLLLLAVCSVLFCLFIPLPPPGFRTVAAQQLTGSEF